MVDEAHERSMQTDILLGLLRKIRRKRKDLRYGTILYSPSTSTRALAIVPAHSGLKWELHGLVLIVMYGLK